MPTVLRNTISAVTTTTMASRISAAPTASASNSRPKACERRGVMAGLGLSGRARESGRPVTPAPATEPILRRYACAPNAGLGILGPRFHGDDRPVLRRLPSIPRQLTQLGSGLRRALDHRLPRHLVGAVEERLRGGSAEVERLDAGGGLAVALRLDLGDLLGVERFEPQRGVVEHLALGIVEALPGVLIDQHVDLDAVERRLHAELGHLIPAEIEDAGDRPAVAVDHAAFERGVDLARRRGDRRAAQRLDHVAVDRRDPDLEAGEVDLVDLLVEVDVERDVVEL